MRHICAVTVARSDFGYLLPILRRIDADPDLQLSVVVTGTHLSPEYGLTVGDVAAAGLPITDRVQMMVAGGTPVSIAKSIALGIAGLAPVYERLAPDILLILGDRFETLAAATAMLPLGRPVAHIAGGESTEGAIDESIRHAITKMSHLHFVATDRYRDRVVQMGEEPWRVVVTGAPTLDNLHTMDLPPREALQSLVGMPLDPAPLLVTFHPVTLEPEETEAQIEILLKALDAAERPIVFTYPNSDTNAHLIIRALTRYVAGHPNARLLTNLGTAAYFALMKCAVAMVGNSSSGIIEAATFELPVVNVGSRQRGRERGANVIDVDCRADLIGRAIEQAVSAEFRRAVKGMNNPYGDGHAARSIVDVLRSVPLGPSLIVKRFHDLPTVAVR